MRTLISAVLFICAACAHLGAHPHHIGENPLIVGGVDAIEHEAPYVVSVQVDRQGLGNFGHTCGGTILSPTWILTAAHCITENEPFFGFRIVAGMHSFSNFSGREEIRATPTIILHEDYVGGVAPFDIALLGLESSLIFILGEIQRVHLPEPDSIPTGDVQLFGWGSTSMTESVSISDVLQTVTKDLMSVEMCREVLRSRYPLGMPIHITNICTGPLNSVITACSGDSGSPIVQMNEENVLVIVGVASWISEFPCGAINAVTVYSRVSAFNDWIQERTGPL